MQMTQAFDDAGKYGTDFLDSGFESIAAVTRNAQAISGEASNYARQVFETGTAAAEKLLSAKSIDKVIEIQTAYAREAYEGLVAESSRMSQLYADMARDACRPFESLVVRAK